MIYKYRWTLLIIFVAGLLIVLLPDSGRPVIRFNKEHGPSVTDLAGLFLMIGCWLLSTIFVAKNRVHLVKKIGNQVLLTLIVTYIISIAAIVAGLKLSIEWLLWVSVAAATVINVSLIVSAFNVAIKRQDK